MPLIQWLQNFAPFLVRARAGANARVKPRATAEAMAALRDNQFSTQSATAAVRAPALAVVSLTPPTAEAGVRSISSAMPAVRQPPSTEPTL